FLKLVARILRKRSVIDRLCDDLMAYAFSGGPVDFLSIDVEGMDVMLLEAINFEISVNVIDAKRSKFVQYCI
ncbi:MAG: hypothetical protein O3A45_01195, partial [Proteobacteria bacterium]|nr:hypothetical protein [Pseudomonadota bacterium]